MRHLNSTCMCVAVFVCVLFPGCQEPTNQERRASFQVNKSNFEGDIQKVGKAVYHFISVDEELESISVEPITGKLTVKFGTDRRFKEALCVGIDESGYFLTAGHAVGNFCYVLGEFNDRLDVRRARIVNRPRTGSQGSDFAILKVESTIHWLPYSPEVTHDQIVFAVVFVQGGDIGGGLDFASGKVKEVQSDPLGYPAKLIDTSVPLRAGDSGGPLFDAGGELVGITQGWQFQLKGLDGKYRRLTCRPEWRLLSQIIEADRKAHEVEASSK